mgnify:CR=1 FL=1
MLTWAWERVTGVSPLTVALIVGAGILLVTLDWARIQGVKREAQRELVTEALQEGANAEAKSDKAHTAASKPGAADRLRKDRATCRDC